MPAVPELPRHFILAKRSTQKLLTIAAASMVGGGEGEYRQTTTPVDHFGVANPFGLCNMHGNVFEWCLDHWHDNYKKAPTDGSAWLNENENQYRVYRGGSWIDNPRNCRSASRYYYSPDDWSCRIGFRVVVAPRGL